MRRPPLVPELDYPLVDTSSVQALPEAAACLRLARESRDIPSLAWPPWQCGLSTAPRSSWQRLPRTGAEACAHSRWARRKHGACLPADSSQLRTSRRSSERAIMSRGGLPAPAPPSAGYELPQEPSGPRGRGGYGGHRTPGEATSTGSWLPPVFQRGHPSCSSAVNLLRKPAMRLAVTELPATTSPP